MPKVQTSTLFISNPPPPPQVKRQLAKEAKRQSAVDKKKAKRSAGKAQGFLTKKARKALHNLATSSNASGAAKKAKETDARDSNRKKSLRQRLQASAYTRKDHILRPIERSKVHKTKNVVKNVEMVDGKSKEYTNSLTVNMPDDGHQLHMGSVFGRDPYAGPIPQFIEDLASTTLYKAALSYGAAQQLEDERQDMESLQNIQAENLLPEYQVNDFNGNTYAQTSVDFNRNGNMEYANMENANNKENLQPIVNYRKRDMSAWYETFDIPAKMTNPPQHGMSETISQKFHNRNIMPLSTQSNVNSSYDQFGSEKTQAAGWATCAAKRPGLQNATIVKPSAMEEPRELRDPIAQPCDVYETSEDESQTMPAISVKPDPIRCFSPDTLKLMVSNTSSPEEENWNDTATTGERCHFSQNSYMPSIPGSLLNTLSKCNQISCDIPQHQPIQYSNASYDIINMDQSYQNDADPDDISIKSYTSSSNQSNSVEFVDNDVTSSPEEHFTYYEYAEDASLQNEEMSTDADNLSFYVATEYPMPSATIVSNYNNTGDLDVVECYSYRLYADGSLVFIDENGVFYKMADN